MDMLFLRNTSDFPAFLLATLSSLALPKHTLVQINQDLFPWNKREDILPQRVSCAYNLSAITESRWRGSDLGSWFTSIEVLLKTRLFQLWKIQMSSITQIVLSMC